MNSLVQIGAGNIGRGFIGPLFSEAGYAITFADIDERMVCEIQRQKKYTVELVSETSRRRITVNNIDAINARDIQKVAQALSVCNLASLSVGVHAVINTVPLLIAGFREREKAADAKPLNILVCENSATVSDELYEKVREEIGERDYAAFCRLVAFVPASIGRMVPQRETRLHGDLLSVVTEEYGELPVDKDAWLGEFPAVRGMVAYSPFRFIIHRKLYIHNMAHAMTAYLGRIVGDEFIHQSIRRPEIKRLVRHAMEESARALSAAYGESAETIMDHAEDLLRRFENRELKDTIVRVGRDVQRKLSPEDRFVGAVRLCDKHRVDAGYIRAGLAAGIHYALNEKTEDDQIRLLYKAGGLNEVLRTVCDLEDNGDVSRIFAILESDSSLNRLVESLNQMNA